MSAIVTRHPARRTNAYAGGARAEGLRPGDFLLVHSYGQFAPRMIGFGQKLHHKPEYAYWTHAALVVGSAAMGSIVEGVDIAQAETLLIEAKGHHPVRYVPLSQYDVRDYAAVRMDADWNPARPDDYLNDMRHNSVRYAESQLGHGYSYLTIATLSAWALFGGRLTVGMSGENVCSGLVANALTRQGELFDGDAVTQMPADLAVKYDVKR